MILPLTSAAVGALGLAYYSPYASRLISVSALRRRVTKGRMLILTYDDGPSNLVTPEILDLLRRHNAKATFFMLGRSARRNASVADLIVKEGHDVGCHTDQHFNAWKVDPWTALADINAGYERLSSWVAPDGMYRPPFGKMTLPTQLAIRRRRAPIGWWTIDSGDTHSPLPDPKRVVDQLLREGGGVVLMHDLERTPERNSFVLDATAHLLEVAARESLKVKRLSELQP